MKRVHDIMAEAGEYPLGAELSRRFGNRTMLVTPLYREGQPFGTILLRRKEVRPFSEREIALLKTFGDQAAIAVENVRLFNEIQDKSRQLELANRHKSEFLANMSHELRTPLKELISQLDAEQFVQVHRAVVVNLHAIKQVLRGHNETANIHLKYRSDVLPVSRTFIHQFRMM